MIWLYARDGETARIETSYDDDKAEYVLRFIDPAHGPSEERFQDRMTYQARLVALEAELEGAEWHITGPPQIVPEGFPRKTPKK